MDLVHTVEHTTNLFSVFEDSDSDPDSKILDSKMFGLDSRKKLFDWTHYFGGIKDACVHSLDYEMIFLSYNVPCQQHVADTLVDDLNSGIAPS